MGHYTRDDGPDFDPNAPGEHTFMSKRFKIEDRIIDIDVHRVVHRILAAVSYVIEVQIDLKVVMRQESSEKELVEDLLAAERSVYQKLTEKPKPTIIDKLKEIGYK